jgi:butyryl-CoA dehydrogenase
MILSQDQEMVRDAVRAFAREQLWPHAARWDREHHFPREAHQGLAALGAYGICVPEEYGGANLDYLTLALVLEEIAAGDGGTSTVISVTNCPVNAILMRYGNARQKKQWLVPLARGEMLGAFALTEPHAGSDASALQTTASAGRDTYVLQWRQAVHHQWQERQPRHRDRGDGPRRRQEGHECLHRADQHTRLPGGQPRAQARATQQRHGPDQPGGCRIPRENLIGQEGEGYRIALSALEGGRIGIAAQSVGMARSAFEVALAYAKERESFGQPIFNHQAVGFAWPIAPPASKPHAS